LAGRAAGVDVALPIYDPTRRGVKRVVIKHHQAQARISSEGRCSAADGLGQKTRECGTEDEDEWLQSAVVTGFNLSPFLGRLGAPRNGVSLVAVSSRPQAAARGSVAGAARVGYRLCMTKGNNENQVSVDADIVQGEEERVALWEEIEREELRMKLAAE
jgi:hypothetical protein